MRRALVALKVAVGVVLALVAGGVVLVALVVGGAVGVARTPWGGERLRRLVLPRLNQAIAGRMDCERLRFGGDRLVLEGLVLRDPEGRMVASVRRLEVEIRWWPLVRRRRVEVPLLDLDTPVVYLLSDAHGGSNLARAIAPRHPERARPDAPAAAAGDGARQPWDGGAGFALDALRIRNGSLGWRDQAAGPGGEEIRADGLALLASGRGDSRAGRPFALHIEGRAEVVSPVREPATLQLDLSGMTRAAVADQPSPNRSPSTSAMPGLDGEARLVFALGDSAIALALTARVQPGAAADPIAHAELDLTRVSLTPDLLRALVPATRTLPADLPPSLTLSGSAIWDAAMERGSTRLALTAGGADARITGSVDLARRPRDGVGVGAAELELSSLDVTLPGGRLHAEGKASAERLGLRAVVDLRDLGEVTGHLRGPARSPRAPRAAGSGRVELALGGSPSVPTLKLTGLLHGLRWQEDEASRVSLDAFIPDLRAPARANVDLAVPDLRLGARHLRDVRARVRFDAGPRLTADLSMGGETPFRLALSGRWASASKGTTTRSRARAAATTALIDALVLSWPGRSWRLERQARVTVAGETLRVEHLALGSADGQRVSLDLHRTIGGLDAEATLTALDLGGLPQVFLPPRLGLAGRLDVKLVLHDRPERRDGGTPSVSRAGAGGGSVELRADVLHLALRGVTVGTVHAELDAGAGRPLGLRLDLPTLPSLPGGAARSGAPTSGRVHLAIGTAFTLARLLHRPPSTQEALSAPVHLEATVEALGLEALGKLLHPPRTLAGRADLRVTLDGPPRAVRGGIALRLAGARVGTPAFPPTDATLDITLGERDMRARARVSRQAGARTSTLATLDGRLGAPLGSLLGLAATGGQLAPGGIATAVTDAPIELQVALGPFELRRAGLQPETDRNPARLLSGRLAAAAAVTGSLRAPRLRLTGGVTNLRLDDTPIGSAQLLVTYADRQASADVQVSSARAGQLHLSATAKADLVAIVRGHDDAGDGAAGGAGASRFDPRRIPVSARLEAKGLDLSGLSGATPGLRTVSGQLFAAATVTGTLGDPRPVGSLEWKEGALTITGLGAYKNIHLLVHGAPERIVLDELRADSGDGHARVTASGTHQAKGGYAIDTVLDLQRFPAYVEGQALASVTLQASAKAEVAVGRVRATSTVQSARVALSDAKRKHLQPLAPAADVIRVDETGAPLNAAQARRLEAVARRLAALGTSPEPTAGARAGDARHQGTAAERPDGARPPAEGPGVVVLVDAPRNLWVSGKDANLELGLAPGFRVEVADTARAFGQVVIKRGRVDVVGRRFDLKAGSEVRFTGPTDRPELEVEAHHVTELENITVVVNVKGTPDRLEVTVRAPDRPDLTESQLYTLIVTGRLDLGDSGGTASATTPTDRAVSLVGGLVAAQLQKTLSKKLPFDVLTIETGNGVGDARLEAGTYLTSELYVGYVGRTGADPALLQNRNAVHLEYELTPRWSFQGEYGDAKTGSADMMWTRRY